MERVLGQKLGHAGLVEHAAQAAGRADGEQQRRPAAAGQADGCQRPANSTPNVMAMAASISGLEMPM